MSSQNYYRYLRRIQRQERILRLTSVILHYDVASGDLRPWFWYAMVIRLRTLVF
jgi:hypothetical protein